MQMHFFFFSLLFIMHSIPKWMCMYLSLSPPLPGGRLVLNAAEDLAGLFVTSVGGKNALKENKAAVFLSQLLLFSPLMSEIHGRAAAPWPLSQFPSAMLVCFLQRQSRPDWCLGDARGVVVPCNAVTNQLPSKSFFLSFYLIFGLIFLFSFFLPHLFTSSFTSSFFLILSGSFVFFCHLHFFPPPCHSGSPSPQPRLSASASNNLSSHFPLHIMWAVLFSSPQLLLPCESRSSSPLARPIVACKKKEKRKI